MVVVCWLLLIVLTCVLTHYFGCAWWIGVWIMLFGCGFVCGGLGVVLCLGLCLFRGDVYCCLFVIILVWVVVGLCWVVF